MSLLYLGQYIQDHAGPSVNVLSNWQEVSFNQTMSDKSVIFNKNRHLDTAVCDHYSSGSQSQGRHKATA